MFKTRCYWKFSHNNEKKEKLQKAEFRLILSDVIACCSGTITLQTKVVEEKVNTSTMIFFLLNLQRRITKLFEIIKNVIFTQRLALNLSNPSDLGNKDTWNEPQTLNYVDDKGLNIEETRHYYSSDRIQTANRFKPGQVLLVVLT